MKKTDKFLAVIVIVAVALLLYSQVGNTGRELQGGLIEEVYMDENGDVILREVFPYDYFSRAGLEGPEQSDSMIGKMIRGQPGELSEPESGNVLSRLFGDFFTFRPIPADTAVSSGTYRVVYSLEGAGLYHELDNGKGPNGEYPVIGQRCTVGQYVQVYEIKRSVWSFKQFVRGNNLFANLYLVEYPGDGVPVAQTYLKSWSGRYGYDCLEPVVQISFEYTCREGQSPMITGGILALGGWSITERVTTNCETMKCKKPSHVSTFALTPAQAKEQLCVPGQCGVQNEPTAWRSVPTPSAANANWQERRVTGFTPAPVCTQYDRLERQTVCLSGYHIMGKPLHQTKDSGHVRCVPVEKGTCTYARESTEWVGSVMPAPNGAMFERDVYWQTGVYPNCQTHEEVQYKLVCDQGYLIEGTTLREQIDPVGQCVRAAGPGIQDVCGLETFYESWITYRDDSTGTFAQQRYYEVSDDCEFEEPSTRYRAECKSGYHVEGRSESTTERISSSPMNCVIVTSGDCELKPVVSDWEFHTDSGSKEVYIRDVKEVDLDECEFLPETKEYRTICDPGFVIQGSRIREMVGRQPFNCVPLGNGGGNGNMVLAYILYQPQSAAGSCEFAFVDPSTIDNAQIFTTLKGCEDKIIVPQGQGYKLGYAIKYPPSTASETEGACFKQYYRGDRPDSVFRTIGACNRELKDESLLNTGVILLIVVLLVVGYFAYSEFFEQPRTRRRPRARTRKNKNKKINKSFYRGRR